MINWYRFWDNLIIFNNGIFTLGILISLMIIKYSGVEKGLYPFALSFFGLSIGYIFGNKLLFLEIKDKRKYRKDEKGEKE